MDEFRDLWDHYLGNMQPTKELQQELEQLFLQGVEKSEVLKHDIAYYHRLHENHPYKTYKFLYGPLCRHVSMEQRGHNRRAQLNLRGHQTKGTALIDWAAPATETKKEADEKREAKKKAKAKAKANAAPAPEPLTKKDMEAVIQKAMNAAPASKGG